MTKRLLSTLFLALLSAWMAAPAAALKTRFVSTTGTGNGLLVTTPYKMQNANAEIDDSDDWRIMVGTGTYPVAPNPDTPPTGPRRATYIANIANPSLTKIQATNNPETGATMLSASNTTVKGFNYVNAFFVGHGVNTDSILSCKIDVFLTVGVSDSVTIADCTGLLSGIKIGPFYDTGGNSEGGTYAADSTTYLRFSRCVFTNMHSTTENCFNVDAVTHDEVGNYYQIGRITNLTIEFCKFDMLASPNSGGGWYLNSLSRALFKYNRWTVRCTYDHGAYGGGAIPAAVSLIRNFTHDVTWRRDTLLHLGPSSGSASMFHYGQDSTGSQYNFTLDSCYVYSQVGACWDVRSGPIKNFRARYTTFVGALTAPWYGEDKLYQDSLVIWHCTLAGKGTTASWRGVVPLEEFAPYGTRAKILFKDNIVYDFGAGLLNAEHPTGVYSCDGQDTNRGHYGITLNIGSKGGASNPCPSATCLTDMNNNLYFEPAQACSDTSCAGTRAIGVGGGINGGSSTWCSRPGDSNAGNTNGRPFEFYWAGRDSLSYWGSPRFLSDPNNALGNRDSTFGLNPSGFPKFNPAIDATSIAIGKASDGSDIGAVQHYKHPTMVLSSDGIPFGDGKSHVPSVAFMTIYNSGDSVLTVTITPPTSNFYSAFVSPVGPNTIAAGSSRVYQFVVTPGSQGSVAGNFTIVSTDPAQPLILLPFTLASCDSPNCVDLPPIEE